MCDGWPAKLNICFVAVEGTVTSWLTLVQIYYTGLISIMLSLPELTSMYKLSVSYEHTHFCSAWESFVLMWDFMKGHISLD